MMALTVPRCPAQSVAGLQFDEMASKWCDRINTLHFRSPHLPLPRHTWDIWCVQPSLLNPQKISLRRMTHMVLPNLGWHLRGTTPEDSGVWWVEEIFIACTKLHERRINSRNCIWLNHTSLAFAPTSMPNHRVYVDILLNQLLTGSETHPTTHRSYDINAIHRHIIDITCTQQNEPTRWDDFKNTLMATSKNWPKPSSHKFNQGYF
jgi:hypothetical protein